MNRRHFLTATAVGAGAGISSVAMQAIAQSMPQIRWRLAASWPKSLDTLYGACEVFAKRVAEITDNRFQIQLFAAGEIVPGLAVLDAVQNQTVEIGNTAAYYYVGKDAALAFGTAVPFGLNARQMESWLVHGGGNDLLQESFNCYGIPMGNTGSQMGGWFRKEINRVEDLRGLKFRIGGFAGQIISRLGVVPQQLAPGDIYSALEKGTIDAVEWIGPADDEKLGLQKIAKYYYYPAWWEGGANAHTLVNVEKWHELPKNYQAVLLAAARDAGNWMTGKYDAANPPAIKRLVAGGVLLRPFSQDIMEACYKAANQVYAETGQTFIQLFKAGICRASFCIDLIRRLVAGFQDALREGAQQHPPGNKPLNCWRVRGVIFSGHPVAGVARSCEQDSLIVFGQLMPLLHVDEGVSVRTTLPPGGVVIVFRDFLETELLVVGGSNPLHRVDRALFERWINISGRKLLRHHAEPTDDLAGKSPDAELQAPQILDPVDFLAKPAAHLAAGITHWDAVAVEAREYLLQQIVAAAMQEP